MTTERPGLAPVPAGMRAVVSHAGVRWTRRTSAATWLMGLGSGAAVATAVGGMLLVATGQEWLAALPALLLVPIVLQLLRTTTVAVTDRAVSVSRRLGMQVERQQFALDALSTVRLVEPHEAQGDWLLVIRGDDEGVTLGRGAPEAHLRWMVQAIDVARAAFAARERAEGREWSFLRKPPEALEHIRGGDDRSGGETR